MKKFSAFRPDIVVKPYGAHCKLISMSQTNENNNSSSKNEKKIDQFWRRKGNPLCRLFQNCNINRSKIHYYVQRYIFWSCITFHIPPCLDLFHNKFVNSDQLFHIFFSTSFANLILYSCKGMDNIPIWCVFGVHIVSKHQSES